jgi:DNA repair exonuclease SbcCD ATPase subunit
MVLFKTIRWKNFLSTGDAFTEVSLNRSPSTLIVGENGAGKSTMLDALSFVLFGKAHRNVNKNQLVNSINNKAAIVEVEFSAANHDFKVIRGIKPVKFEIWQNGAMINQAAQARDYQKHLEQNILKLNHKSFHQIIVLGSSSFIPFMQLPTYARREVIEDLLDIQIFGKMNGILKEKLSRLKEDITSIVYALELVKEKLTMQKNHIRDITEINKTHLKQKTEKIDSIKVEIDQLQTLNQSLSNFVADTNNGLDDSLKSLGNKKSKLSQYQAQFMRQISDVVTTAKFYEDNNTCPTCTQEITEDTREHKMCTAKDKAKTLREAMTSAETEIKTIDTELNELNELAVLIRQSNSEIHTNNSGITRLQNEIKSINTEIELISSEDSDLSRANQQCQDFIEERDILSERRLKMLESKTYLDVVSEMLKDTGIKTKIIKEYLPVMNTLINKYLNVLDFFVSFHLDENFNEVIRSRHRDDFNYSSFSEGEKQRINLALLFAWRQIARMKNSASTNLLILDEVLDASLDAEGVENLMKILNTVENDTNVFIISHKGDVLDGKFRSKIEFKKHQNFSTMVTTRG